jgi:hypothetical protein
MKQQKEQPVEEKVEPTEMVLPLELAQALLNYLGSKPYSEVAGLVNGIQDSKLQ